MIDLDSQYDCCPHAEYLAAPPQEALAGQRRQLATEFLIQRGEKMESPPEKSMSVPHQIQLPAVCSSTSPRLPPQPTIEDLPAEQFQQCTHRGFLSALRNPFQKIRHGDALWPLDWTPNILLGAGLQDRDDQDALIDCVDVNAAAGILSSCSSGSGVDAAQLLALLEALQEADDMRRHAERDTAQLEFNRLLGQQNCSSPDGDVDSSGRARARYRANNLGGGVGCSETTAHGTQEAQMIEEVPCDAKYSDAASVQKHADATIAAIPIGI